MRHDRFVDGDWFPDFSLTWLLLLFVPSWALGVSSESERTSASQSVKPKNCTNSYFWNSCASTAKA